MANTYELIVKTVDRSSRPLQNIERSLARVERRSRTVSGSLRIAGAALVAFAGARALGSIIKVTANFEDLNTTLASVTGSAKAGADAFSFIQRFATQTQFGIEDLSNTFIKLQAAGIEPSEKLLRTFTDTAAVTTDQLGTLQAVTDLLSRTTGGGLGLEELERLADRGIPVYRILGDEIGLARSEVSEFGKTAEGAAKIVDALLNGLDKTFGGATARRAQNLSTIVSNFQIATRNAIGEFGAGLAPALKEVIGGLTEFINANQNVFRALGQGSGEVLRLLATGVSSLADSLGLLRAGGLQNIFAGLLDGLASFIIGFEAGVNKILSGITGIANGFNQMIVSISNLPGAGFDAVFAEDVAAIQNRRTEIQQEIALMEESLVGLQQRFETASGNQTLLDKLGLGSNSSEISQATNALVEVRTAINMAQAEYERLGNNIGEDTIILERFTREVSTSGTAAQEAAAGIRETAEALRESGRAAEINEQFPFYEDAIFKFANAQQTATDTSYNFAAALDNTGNSAANAAVQLTGYQKFLDQLLVSAGNSVAQTQYATAAQTELNEMFRMGQISGEEYSIALERVNQILGVDTPEAANTAGQAIATVASTYKDATQAITDFELRQTNVSGAMSRLEGDFNSGKINLEQFRVGMDSMGVSMKDVSDKSIVMGMTITDAFTSAGDSLASGLARGIVRGEGIMNSFKNFMSSILETILTQIIQQAFIGPLVSSMTTGLGQAFSAFGAGGAGAFGGGGFGSMIGGSLFGPIGGMLGGFLGFAEGGIVPGRSTAGDSVPIMATPGEVILNKGQQAAMLSGGANQEPITVNFNMNTIDSRSGTEFILQNKKQITSVIQQAYNTRGQSGPLG